MITKAIALAPDAVDLGKREAVIKHSTYKSLDGDGDRSNRGMFDKSWKENMGLLRFFLNHNRKEAPGKVLQTWDDDAGAFTRVKMGTHTLGEDVLKMLDEGIIVAASFGFEPLKFKDIKGKGKDYLEVKHLETSVLTHWGAHEESGVVNVQKMLNQNGPKLQLKQLTQPEQTLLRQLIINGMDNIRLAVQMMDSLDVDSDLYTAIHYIISRNSEQIADLKSQLRWGMKEAADIEARVKSMESFIRNTKASDDAIAMISKSLKSLLHKNSDTATTTGGTLLKCGKCNTYSACAQDEQGNTKCAECGHALINKGGNQPEASRSKDDLKKKLLLLKAKMSMSDND